VKDSFLLLFVTLFLASTLASRVNAEIVDKKLGIEIFETSHNKPPFGDYKVIRSTYEEGKMRDVVRKSGISFSD
jgi:hypothetical protein